VAPPIRSAASCARSSSTTKSSPPRWTPETASTILDRLLHLRLLGDLEIEPDHLAAILRSDAPLDQPSAPPAPPSPARSRQFAPPGFTALCRDLSDVPVTIDLPARLHERSLATADASRKHSGSFYTPTAIVGPLLDAALTPLLADQPPEQLARLRICDLACGPAPSSSAPSRPCSPPTSAGTPPTPATPAATAARSSPITASSLSAPGVRRSSSAASSASTSTRAHSASPERALHLHVLAGHPGYREPPPSANLHCLDALAPGALERHFPAALQAGGFDAIVGNPPYVRPHNLDPHEKASHRAHYSVFRAKADLYACFMQRATGLLRPGGRLAYVVARGWLALDSFDVLRRHLLDHYRLEQILELPARVFPEAQVETLAFVFQREPDAQRRDQTLLRVRDLAGATLRTIPQRAFADTYCNVLDLSIDPARDALKTTMRQGPTLGSRYDILFGLKTGDDAKFLHTRKRHHADRPLLRGDDIRRYGHTWRGEYVRYLPEKMRAHRSTARPGEPARFEQPKVLVKDTSRDFGATYEDGAHYVKDVLIVLPRPGVPAYDLKALLGVLNSQALRFYYRSTFPTLHVQSKELASLPLPTFDLTTRPGRAAHDRLVGLVEQRLDLEAQHPLAPTDSVRQQLTTRIRSLERRIDDLVNAHYGLDAAAVRVLEAALTRR
jgi:hypothetical protein